MHFHFHAILCWYALSVLWRTWSENRLVRNKKLFMVVQLLENRPWMGEYHVLLMIDFICINCILIRWRKRNLQVGNWKIKVAKNCFWLIEQAVKGIYFSYALFFTTVFASINVQQFFVGKTRAYWVQFGKIVGWLVEYGGMSITFQWNNYKKRHLPLFQKNIIYIANWWTLLLQNHDLL